MLNLVDLAGFAQRHDEGQMSRHPLPWPMPPAQAQAGALQEPPGSHDLLRLRLTLSQAMQIRYFDALTDGPQGAITPTISVGEPRARALRAQPHVDCLSRQDSVGRFWFREASFVALLMELARHSSWLNGSLRPISFTELGRTTGLSKKTLSETLESAHQAGDVLKCRSRDDARQLCLEPAPHLLTEVETVADKFAAQLATFLNRPSPIERFDEKTRRLWLRLYCDLFLNSVSRVVAPETRLQTNFFYTIWDLLLDGPVPARIFVVRQAERLGVSTMAVRNILARAADAGLLHCGPDRVLVASDEASRRYDVMITLKERRWSLLWDVLDAVAEKPELAPWVFTQASPEAEAA